MTTRGIPGARERGGMRGAPELVRALARHADRLGGEADLAGIGQHLDEAPLLLLGPPVEPRAAANGDPAILGGVVDHWRTVDVVVVEDDRRRGRGSVERRGGVSRWCVGVGAHPPA